MITWFQSNNVAKSEEKRVSKKLNSRLMIYYIANWG